MRLVLHIGMGKTGTSTLQTTLSNHTDLLGRAGVLYPTDRTFPASANGPVNHSVLTCLVRPPDRVPRRFRATAAGDESAIPRMGADFWEAFTSEVYRSAPRVVVLSGEHLFYLRPEEVARLRELLGALFDDIQVVAYIRHPVPYYLSVTQQQVRASYDVTPPGRFHIPLESLLRRYLASFDDRVLVRAFERAELVEQCIVKDFVHTALPEASEVSSLLRVSDRNESMSAEAMCILQKLRRFGWPEENDQLAFESDLVANVLKGMRERSAQTASRLRPGLAATITRRHRSDLEWLQQRFGLRFREIPDAESDAAIITETSNDLEDIVDVDRANLDRVYAQLLRELAERATRRAVHRRRWLGPFVAAGRRVRNRLRSRPTGSDVRPDEPSVVDHEERRPLR